MKYLIAALFALQSSNALARTSETAALRPIRSSVAQDDGFGEKARKADLEKAVSERDLDKVMQLASPPELTQALHSFGARPAPGEARQLPSGTSLTGYAVRINIHLSKSPQHLEMNYPGGKLVARGSGGERGYSNLLKGHCFSVDSDDLPKAKTMQHPIFFRGKRGPGNSELPNTFTYGIHGLPESSGYMKKLGTPASHGCFRVSNADAKKIQSIVRGIGKSNAVVCVD